MPSTVLDPIAGALESLIEGIAGLPFPINAMKWERLELDPLPAATVHVPQIERTAVGEAELQLGSLDWQLSYTVSLYFDLDDAVTAQARMVEYVEAFIKAVDQNPTLGLATVDEAKVVSAVPFHERERRRPLAGYECEVQLLALVAS